MEKTNVDRMELAKVVEYFANHGLTQTADYFRSYMNDPYSRIVENGWIQKSFIRRHIGEELMRDLECEVLTWVAF